MYQNNGYGSYCNWDSSYGQPPPPPPPPPVAMPPPPPPSYPDYSQGVMPSQNDQYQSSYAVWDYNSGTSSSYHESNTKSSYYNDKGSSSERRSSVTKHSKEVASNKPETLSHMGTATTAATEIVTNNSSENVTNTESPACTSYQSPLVPRGKEPEPQILTANKTTPINNKRPLPVEIDPNLPDEIIALLKNNNCDLCSVKLNSRIQAKNHYQGKPHEKKVKNAVAKLKGDSESTPTVSTGEPQPKKKKSVTDGSQLYCKCCDLSFTSMEHATQHYLGRNHRRVLYGLKPLKAGYYNKETGKWQRMPLDPVVSTERLDKNSSDPDSVMGKGKFFCDLCGVSATSQDQLDGHLKGHRHKKALDQAAKNKPVAKSQKDSILASVIKGDDSFRGKQKDFSMYRTPSGKYYCGPCNTTLNSESQFAQHVESKKHIARKK